MRLIAAKGREVLAKKNGNGEKVLVHWTQTEEGREKASRVQRRVWRARRARRKAKRAASNGAASTYNASGIADAVNKLGQAIMDVLLTRELTSDEQVALGNVAKFIDRIN